MKSILIIVAIAAVAAILSFVSYQYSIYNANAILKIASDDADSNANIQAHDFSTIVKEEFDKVTAVLNTLATAPAIHNGEIRRSYDVINLRQETTKNITDSYFWLDKDGKLLWSSKFANDPSFYHRFKDVNLGNRPYFTIPKKTGTVYYSSVIESFENTPTIYISMPIIDNIENSSSDTTIFEGVIVGAIRTDTLGNFVKNQIPPGFPSQVGLIDKNGIILYTANQTYTGKTYFGKEFQSSLSTILSSGQQNDLNDIIKHSLQGNSGTQEITARGQTTTIAYTPIKVNGETFMILYVTLPHHLAGDVSLLIDQQRAFNTILIIVIGAVAAGIAFLILLSNRRLAETVKVRTAELKASNESLVVSNQQLAKLNQQLDSANQQLLKANEQLKINDKMQKEFINIAAHELRTPTQAIIGYAELFDTRPEDIQEIMKAVTRNANRLQRLTDDILDVTRIEGNALNLNKENFSLKEVISYAIDDAKSRPTNHGRGDGSGAAAVNNETKFVLDFPEDITLYADKARINQVIVNFLSNAIKFTRNDIITIKAEQQNKEEDGQHQEVVVVSVKDTGAGIHHDIFPRLFTKFASKSQTGTGLGLFISKSIVEAHGGKIWAENNKDGKGATFAFSLPVRD